MAEVETEAEVQEPREAIYYSQYPNLRGSYYTKEDGEKVKNHFQLKDGTLRLSDPEHVEALDREIATQPSLSAVLRKVDFDAAEKLAKEHQQKRLSRSSGHSGPFTTESILRVTGQERLHAALGPEATPETVAKVQEQLSRDGMEIPEDVKPVQQIPDPTGPVAEKSEEAKEQKKAFFGKK